ncbi:MAG: hypothetical protein M0R73_06330 [Dehalococcoidia bacterium]|nr:hypothetical protein [Dehalococcoidia bacterium]
MKATILGVQPYELHGTLYYRVIFTPEGQDQPREARLSHDMVYPDPKAGDVIEVHAILGVVDGIAKVEA